MNFFGSSVSKRILIPFITCLLLSGLGRTPARAFGQSAPSQDNEEMQKKMDQLEKEMQDLKNQMDAAKQAAALEKATQEAAAKEAAAKEPTASPAETGKPAPKGTFNIYGAVMLDSGYNFGQIDPNWFDVMRPTKLDAYKDEFAPSGTVFFSVRQTRFGIKTSSPTKYGDLKTWFEFELFGTGSNAGQTTFRLRQAYGELGHFGAGQTWSPFMDIDVFPNSLEYWGPNGMVFFRNIQFRWMPLKGRNALTIAAERPGASADQSNYGDFIDLTGVRSDFNLPDLSVQGRFTRKWGYVQEAVMLRKIAWTDLNKTPAQDLSRQLLGWGFNTTSNVNLGAKDVLRLEAVYGDGIENYMNDATVDVAPQLEPGTALGVKGVAVPVLGVVAFLDHNWTKKLSTAGGYSAVNMWNPNGQQANAFHHGDYALTNLLYNPIPSFMFGGEFQYGRRVNFSDGFSVNDYKVQFSFKYNYSKVFGY